MKFKLTGAPIEAQPTPEAQALVAQAERCATLVFPDVTLPPIYKIQLGPIGQAASPHPWFMPMPIRQFGWTLYQVATVITVEGPEYPSGGTTEEKAEWRREYEARLAEADARAQLQAPGCTRLENNVLGCVYVWNTDIREQLAAGLQMGAHDLFTPLYLAHPVQEITAEQYMDMLEVLPPLAMAPSASSVRGHLMSEYQTGNITSAFVFRAGTLRYYHLYVDTSVPDVWHDISVRLRAVEFSDSRSCNFITGARTRLHLGQADRRVTLAEELTQVKTLLDAQNLCAEWSAGLFPTEVGGSIKVFPVVSYIKDHNKV